MSQRQEYLDTIETQKAITVLFERQGKTYAYQIPIDMGTVDYGQWDDEFEVFQSDVFHGEWIDADANVYESHPGRVRMSEHEAEGRAILAHEASLLAWGGR